jgi:hypothetical protein
MTAAGLLAYVLGFVSMAFGVVRAVTFGDTSLTPLFFALWSVTMGALVHAVPVWWHRGATYRVTTGHVIWARGPFHRAIERTSISFARIHWSLKLSHVGTLELVCAVPVGALRRKMKIELEGIESPDGVWAIIRGAEDVATSGHGDLPISQRLDRGERILWSAKPLPSLRAYLPSGTNQWYLSAIALSMFAMGALLAVRSVSILERLASAGLNPKCFSFWALTFGLAFGLIAVVTVGAFIVNSVVGQRARSLRDTRYLISNKRVLIQCGRDELHLDRRHIVDIIDTPAGLGKTNLFLVLDGPRARALAASGAFGEYAARGLELLPVFECVQDGEGAKVALSRRSPSLPPVPCAA